MFIDMKRFGRLILLVLLLITAAVCLSSCQRSDQQRYEEKRKAAEELLAQRKYAEAALEMEELKDYEPATVFARYCRGLEAGEQGQRLSRRLQKNPPRAPERSGKENT